MIRQKRIPHRKLTFKHMVWMAIGLLVGWFLLDFVQGFIEGVKAGLQQP